ncbi:MAG: HEPN domain-containing protein [SAR324 cluster bacterium]|nr:HEPN domain-containing protein [SAR324 cluster bacterium]
MKSAEMTLEAIQYWWQKAEECLESAQREFEARSYEFVLNRLYYAVFYGASAALLDRQQSFKKHSGVRAAFHHEFIKTGLLDIAWGKFYDHLFEDRQEVDYVAFITFEESYVQQQMAQCKEFLKKLHSLIPALTDK